MADLSKRVAKAGIIALEIVGVAIAAVAGLTAFVYWRLQSGPVSLALLKGGAESAFERALAPGHDATIAKATLSRGQAGGEYDLIFDRVEIAAPSGRVIARLPRIVAGFSTSDLLRGKIGPSRILATDPVFHLERGTDRKAARALARRGDARRGFIRALSGGRYFHDAFKSAEFVRTQIHFQDALSGRSWRADGARAKVVRAGEGFAAQIEGVFDSEGRAAPLRLDASFGKKDGGIFVDMRIVDAPIGELLSMVYGPEAAIVSAPVTGAASITVARSGEVLASRLSGHAGAGVLKIGGVEADIASIDVDAAFDPALNRFDIDRFKYEIGGSSGEIDGAVDVVFAPGSLSPSAVGFTLGGDNIVVNAPGFFPEPLSADRLEATGEYDIVDRRLSFSSVKSALLGVELDGSFSFSRPLSEDAATISPAIKADITVAGALDRDRLLLVWPLHVGEGARDFVAARMPRGEAANIALHLDLPAGALIEGAPMPDEAMALTFDIVDATAVHTIGMTPVTGAFGSGRLTGNRFFIDNVRGRIGAVPLSAGEIEFTALSPKWQPVHFRFTAAGAASDILGVLDEKPLELLAPTNLDPAKFIGEAVVRVDITRPNRREVPREAYGYAGKATFEDLSITEFYGGIDVTGARGEIDLASRSMIVTADADFGGAPINFEWRQKFYAVDGRSEFRIAGRIDSSTGDVFGVPTRELLRGPVAFEARAIGDLGALDAVSISADFTEAALTFDSFGWMKPQGAPAKGALDLAFDEAGIDVRSLTLVGDGADISGVAKLGRNGVVQSASFPRFFLDDGGGGGADFTLSAARSEAGSLELVMIGPFLNAGPFFEAVIEGAPESEARQPFDWGEGVSVRARIDDLALRAGAHYRDAALDFRRSAERLESFALSARTVAGAPVSMALAETGEVNGPAQTIEARTDDIGALMAGVFGVTSIRGGEGSMRIQIHSPVNGQSQGLTGLIDARGLRVVGAPLLARIFSAGSLGGLADLVNGEGIELSQASGEFGFNKGVFTLHEARASGPSVGLTASGAIARGGRGGIDLNGAVAPMYQVNSILGRAPVIGDIFVGREGEGVVAMAYHVTGPIDAPTVAVNPLSALAPGFLRRMFDPVREEVSEE